VNIRAATQTTNLGRYHVVKRLAAGGMADVLLARTIGIEGFERHVVIKRIHPELGDEPRYRKMFLDEARLAASLHHHNIVQVNDIGEEDDKYFFAMEYVHGEDTRTLLIKANNKQELIPLEHVLTIVTHAAAGLHHAHEQRGPDRKPLNIVHRDVSPANILIGYDGGVKVADFGIAQAAHRSEQTQSGVLKGKASYMSPEQCNCAPLDRRSDVFSLGIVLYELVTVHPCFKGENDFMTMSAIVQGRYTRPTELVPTLPRGLETIIEKALALNPDDRYAICDEMRIAVEAFATYAGVRTSTTALADYMQEQFGSRPEPWLEEPDHDMEIAVSGSSPLDLQLELILKPIPVEDEDEDDLAVPMAPAEPPSEPEPRAVKMTLPLRALKSAPVEKPKLAEAVPIIETPLPFTARVATVVTRPFDTGRIWLAGSIILVISAALALVLAARDSAPVPSASTIEPAPRVDKVEPQFTATQNEVPTPTPPPTTEPAPKPEKAEKAEKAEKPAATKQPSKKSATKKWDPDALFPN
jgi:serine/threonine protein kinase